MTTMLSSTMKSMTVKHDREEQDLETSRMLDGGQVLDLMRVLDIRDCASDRAIRYPVRGCWQERRRRHGFGTLESSLEEQRNCNDILLEHSTLCILNRTYRLFARLTGCVLRFPLRTEGDYSFALCGAVMIDSVVALLSAVLTLDFVVPRRKKSKRCIMLAKSVMTLIGPGMEKLGTQPISLTL